MGTAAAATHLLDLPPLLAWKDICLLMRMSRPTITRLIRSGEFPRPVRLGRGRRAIWTKAVIRDYLDALDRQAAEGVDAE